MKFKKLIEHCMTQCCNARNADNDGRKEDAREILEKMATMIQANTEEPAKPEKKSTDTTNKNNKGNK